MQIFITIHSEDESGAHCRCGPISPVACFFVERAPNKFYNTFPFVVAMECEDFC